MFSEPGCVYAGIVLSKHCREYSNTVNETPLTCRGPSYDGAVTWTQLLNSGFLRIFFPPIIMKSDFFQ